MRGAGPTLAGVAKLVLPGGVTVAAHIASVRASQGSGYAPTVATACAYLDGMGRGDVESQLAKHFPNTHGSIEACTIDALRAVAEAKALVFDGNPKLGLVDAKSKADVAENASGRAWSDVITEAGAIDALRRVDVRSVVSRLAFARVLWDKIDGRLRIDVFDADKVFPCYDVDRPDLATAPFVLLELAPVIDAKGEQVRRFEAWTAEVDGDGATVGASVVVVDETGEILSDPRENPYGGPDGRPGQNKWPVIPIVAFGDLAQTPWPWPFVSVIDGQRALSVELSNALHCAILQSHGQWTATQTDQNADSWSGGARSSGGSMRTRTQETSASVNVAFGPDVLSRAPFGWRLDHVTQGAQLAEIRAGFESRLRQFCTTNGIPAGVLVDSARNASGVALLVEREPLERYRRERIAAFDRAAHRFTTICRIVWNTHHEEPERFLSPGGVRAQVTFDRLRPLMDPIAAADLAVRLGQTGLFSDAERLAKVEGITVAEAEARLTASAEARAATQARREGLVGKVFASPLTQARGAVDDDEADA